MSSFSDYLEDELLDHVFNNAAFTSPTTVYAALFSADPTDAGGGTELTGNGYARQAITFGTSSGGAIANTADVVFTASGGNWLAATSMGIFDASTAGNMLAWDTITSAQIDATETLTFATGDIDVTLA